MSLLTQRINVFCKYFYEARVKIILRYENITMEEVLEWRNETSVDTSMEDGFDSIGQLLIPGSRQDVDQQRRSSQSHELQLVTF